MKNPGVNKAHLLDFDLSQWEEFIEEHGHKKYRAMQIFEWLHRHQVLDVEEFNNVPDSIKALLYENFLTEAAKVLKHIKAADGTEKILIEYPDGRQVETVWLRLRNRNTVCISTQAGCSLYCDFCMTAKGKFLGNLSSGEILEQVYLFKKLTGEKVNNVVFMGMGEPLMNYENSIKAAFMLKNERGLNIGFRRITISTAGVLPAIKRFIEEDVPFNLALSVNSLDHDSRLKIMDSEAKWPLEKIIEYLSSQKSSYKKNKITIEYIMIKDLNMSSEDAKNLAMTAIKINAKINLIPLNNETGEYKKPSDDLILAFWEKIMKYNVLVYNRSSPGYEIQAACGMLKAKGGA